MRQEGWERRLQAYIDTVGPFEWGKTDCCMFTGGAVHVMTGQHFGEGYQYRTAAGAAKALARHGGVSAIATKYLGAPKSIKLAQRGDVVSFDAGEGIALGICVGDKIAAMQKGGLIFLPLSAAIKAWSV